MSADQAKGTFRFDDPEIYADDYGREISPVELAEMEKERKRRLIASRPIVRWAIREGMALYEGKPGYKHPLKKYFDDGNWVFRPWPGTGTALGHVRSDQLILDGDTDEGKAAIAAMNLPPHFAIRSKISGGEKHFFRCDNPPKRMIRALPGLDVLSNPDSKWIWAKVDNGGDDSGYEIISDTEDHPDIPDEVLAALVKAKTSGAIIKDSGTRPGRTRKVDPQARWDDDDELLPTEHYAEHGIPHGLQEDRLYRLADRFAAQGMNLGEGTEKLLAIAGKCEQDDRDPWTREQLEEKMTRAIAWIASLPKGNFKEPGLVLDTPEPLTDIATPWRPKDPAETVTGLDPDGRVPLNGDVKKDNDPHDVLRLAWAVALGHASPHIAVLGRDLVVVSGAEKGSLDIGLLDARRLRSLCANGLTYTHHVKKRTEQDADGKEIEVTEEWDEPALPSIQLCGTVLADPAIRLYRPVLGGITAVPVLRPDGTLLEVQGVDAATSMIYWPVLPVGPIPAKPSRSEVAAAKKFLLDELMHDFPWSSPADKANCLGMWLTSYLEPYARYLSPLNVLDASKSSSGKGFLATVMVETTGAYFRSWVNLEEEIRKALTACLMESDPVIILDDVGKKDTVSSATLASVLTKRQWDDRVLGVSKNFRGENNRSWCLTANNVKLGGDIPSRSVLIHLDPGPGDPKDRDVSKFKLGDISVWLTQDQNKIKVIRALLILIADWAAHDCPRAKVRHRFAAWAAVVGGVLEHHKIDGFLANQARVEQHVHYDEHLGDFFSRWYELHKDVPQGVKTLRDALGAKDAERQNDLIWKGQWPRGKNGNLLTWKALGKELRDVLSQDHGGYQVDVVSDGHGGDHFKVTPVEYPDEPAEPASEQKDSSQSQP